MPTPLPPILCLHGGGTSSAIFSVQTRQLRSVLQAHFTFVFVNAPIETGPGPGVLPYFEGSGPYFSWLSGSATSEAVRSVELEAINSSIGRALARRGMKSVDVVGVMGFSQGGDAASLLLWQAQGGEERWSGLRFGIVICGRGQEDVVGVIGERLEVPSLHLHGLRDPWLAGSRVLTKCFQPDNAVVMEFEGGHHIPTKRKDIERLAALAVEINKEQVMGLQRTQSVRISTAKVRDDLVSIGV